LLMKCPKCQHENTANAKFCEECAAPLALACVNCGSQVSSTARFCPPMWPFPDAGGGQSSLCLAEELHASAPYRQDPHLEGGPSGWAKAGHCVVRRHQSCLLTATQRPRRSSSSTQCSTH